jgi:hypothetical protein
MKRSLLPPVYVALSCALCAFFVGQSLAYAEFPPVKFLEVRSPVPHGGQGLVTIQTKPGTTCGITIVYKTGLSRAAGLGLQTADSRGYVTWTWKVGTRTTPGTWPIIVECGTEQITRVHTTFDVT